MESTSQSVRIGGALALAIPALLLVGGCVHHHHDVYEPEHVVVVDPHGYRHEGYRDDHGWHGGYYDEQHVFHDDPHDWDGDRR